MNINKKNKNLSNTSLLNLIVYSTIILLFLWVVQIGYLKIFYEKYQLNKISNIVDQLEKTNENINEFLEGTSYESGVCIEIYTPSSAYKYNSQEKNCILNSQNPNILSIKNKLYQNDKEKEYVIVNDPVNKSRSLIYGVRLSDSLYVFINTNLEDVNSTTAVLKSQLIYITLIVILLAVISSYYISKRLNEPILKITDRARDIAEGNYELDNSDYKIEEINELKNVLNYARSEIENTDNLRRDLMANVSHDLKTPLTMIKAYAEMAKDLHIDDKEKIKDNLSIIISETNRLNILVDDILNLSRMQNEELKPDLEDYDLIEELNEILKRYEYIKETENYIFELNIPKIALVNADKKQINQVIYNLINNAINYTGDDLIVKINIKENKNTFLVEIIDTGKGIDKTELNLIWTKYYKKDKKYRRNVIGTGLGLSIVQNILTQHNFEYGVESQKNIGTKFYFKIKKSKIK